MKRRQTGYVRACCHLLDNNRIPRPGFTGHISNVCAYRELRIVATPKRGKTRVDLTGVDGKSKMDVRYNPISDRYDVRIGKCQHNWSATEFSKHFRKWLVRQKVQHE